MIRHRKSLAVALGFVFSAAVLANGPKPVAYVSNQEGGVTVIDLERMEKARDIEVGGRGPRGIGITDDGRYLITANKDTARAKALEVFDTKTFARIAAVPLGERCWHFTFTPDYGRILVACGRSHDVHVIDAERYTTLKVLGGFKLPWGVVTYPKTSGSLDAP